MDANCAAALGHQGRQAQHAEGLNGAQRQGSIVRPRVHLLMAPLVI